MEEDCAKSALPILQQAFSNLLYCASDGLGGALNFDNTLGGLGEHLLLRDHAYAGVVLDLLDLQTLATDDGAHLVVRDEEADGWVR